MCWTVLDNYTIPCNSQVEDPRNAVLSPMRMHPIISILLATWFGLGATLGPRFLCSCGDGSVTVEIGHRFCCDTDESCCDSCDGGETSDEGPGDAVVHLWSCADGCESTLLSDGFVGPLERGANGHAGAPSQPVHADFTTIGAHCRTSTIGVKCAARAPDWRTAGLHQLRSVILLI